MPERPTCATCYWWIAVPNASRSFCTHPTTVMDDGLGRRYPERPATDWCGAHTPMTLERDG